MRSKDGRTEEKDSAQGCWRLSLVIPILLLLLLLIIIIIINNHFGYQIQASLIYTQAHLQLIFNFINPPGWLKTPRPSLVREGRFLATVAARSRGSIRGSLLCGWPRRNKSGLQKSSKSGVLHHKWGIFIGFIGSYIHIIIYTTVDGRNPAPPGMYKTLQIIVDSPYQLVQDFFHQQYVRWYSLIARYEEYLTHVSFLALDPDFPVLLGGSPQRFFSVPQNLGPLKSSQIHWFHTNLI